MPEDFQRYCELHAKAMELWDRPTTDKEAIDAVYAEMKIAWSRMSEAEKTKYRQGFCHL